MTGRPTNFQLLFANLKLLVLGGVGLGLLVAGGLDEFGRTFAIFMTVACLGLAGFRIRRALQTPVEDSMVRPVTGTPSDIEQIRVLRRARLTVTLAILVLTTIVSVDLTLVERGTAPSTSTWSPIAILFDQLGYWPAILATPVLGALLWILATRRIREMEGKLKGP
jgi:hypothetical protein